MVICMGQGSDLYMAQLIPLSLMGSKSKFKTEFDVTQCVRSNSVLNLDLDPSLVSDFRL